MSQPNTNNATFPAISEQDARELVQDRIKFKLYTAEHHLNNLRHRKKWMEHVFIVSVKSSMGNGN
jgi:hypothetical protein